jgi:A/G-specific adenine glycosylase
MSPPARSLRTRLLAHYRRARRDLPWRRTRDPYAIWISEIMLQQTRVESVIPYYRRWMERFPDVAALAGAEVDDVLHAWEGLGYYSRARNLHRAAQEVRDRFAGDLPSDPAALRTLPGIGPYTAGAIGSIAFGVVTPAVDGNVKRVLARLLDLPAPTAAELHRHAAALVDPDEPGDFNQALMELGATVCTPRSPGCTVCPLRSWCLARVRGTVLDRPERPVRSAIPHRAFAVGVVVDADGRVLVRRRPEDGLLGGLWEFPGAEVGGAHSVDAGSRLALHAAMGPASHPAGMALDVVHHAFTHFRASYHAYLFVTDRSMPETGRDASRWLSPEGLERLAFPVAQRKIWARARRALSNESVQVASTYATRELRTNGSIQG